MANHSKMVDEVIVRLELLGYHATGNDNLRLCHLSQLVEYHITDITGTDRIPRKINLIAVDRVCGEFLYELQQTGQLEGKFNLEKAVKSVNMGDTSVTFTDATTPEQRLDSLINHLRTQGESDVLCYRKLKW